MTEAELQISLVEALMTLDAIIEDSWNRFYYELILSPYRGSSHSLIFGQQEEMDASLSSDAEAA